MYLRNADPTVTSLFDVCTRAERVVFLQASDIYTLLRWGGGFENDLLEEKIW